jgi:ubiquinone/menaquinone biosynthesis C-methylase UbiE
MPTAAQAFDAIADTFDERFGAWQSVAAQRSAVRAELLDAFAAGAHVLEIGGGTGEDALWLAERGRRVFLTDASPSMVGVARAKLRAHGARAEVVAAEDLAQLGAATFDGAFSNFAALNCVTDLTPVARALARLVRPGGSVLIVLFGIVVPGEWIVQLMRGDWRAIARRSARGDVSARLGGKSFSIRYHRHRAVERAFHPNFRLVGRRGIGVFVPPSAAEPWISRHPRMLSTLGTLDRLTSRALAPFGDHVLYRFERHD